MWLFKTRKQYPENDAEIISAYKSTGDKQLIGILFERYAHLVYGVCYKYVKDKEVCRDATLFIFEKLFTDLKKYEVTNFSSWLHSVARNYCFAYMKTAGRDVSLDEITLNNLTDSNDYAEEDDLIKKHLSKLNDALAAINDEQQTCVRMFYLDDKSYIEIAEQTGYSLNQVKSFIQNGKRNLRIYLTKQQGK
ncbi:MAG: sigma-70 family RNA polymerase sigma factor [Bacteroidia bacterium]